MASTMLDIHTSTSGSLVGISVEEGPLPPVDICLCLDTSYSIDDEATIKLTDNEADHKGYLTILDLVKHASKAVVHGFSKSNPSSTVSVVKFSSTSHIRTVCSSVSLTPDGVVTLDRAIDSLASDGQTDIWGGLKHALRELGTSTPDRKKYVLLLTDGQPNIDPSLGYSRALAREREAGMNAEIYTFGFGYNIKSQLLQQLSDNKFSFIPDAGMIATSFVNTISNIAVITKNVGLINVALEGVTFKDGTSETDLPIIPLQMGTTKYVLIPPVIHSDSDYRITVTMGDVTSNCVVNSSKKDMETEVKLLRYKFIEFIRELPSIPRLRGEQKRQELFDYINKYFDVSHLYVESLLLDLNGQFKEGLSNDAWYQKWFLDYCRSCLYAQTYMHCNNFKDASIQDFHTGTIYEKLRDDVDNAFTISVTAPTLRPRVSPISGGSALPPTPTPTPTPAEPVDMRQYYNSGGG